MPDIDLQHHFQDDPQMLERSGYAKEGFVEYVPTVWLLQFCQPGWKLENATTISESTAAIGYREELILIIGQKDRKVDLGEGRHRLMAAIINRRSHVPLRISRSCEVRDGIVCNHMARVPSDWYFPADAYPSEVFDPGFIPDMPYERGRRLDMDRTLGDTGLANERAVLDDLCSREL